MPARSRRTFSLVTAALLLASGFIVRSASAADQNSAPPTPPDTIETATQRLQELEARKGPTSPEVIAALLQLADVTIATGDPATADGLLDRANSLLDRYPAMDRAWRLQVLVLKADSLAKQGRLQESNEALFAARSLAQNTTTIGPLELAKILDRLVANETRRGRTSAADSYAREALAIREKAYGPNSLQYAGALFTLADWFRASAQFGRERDAEDQALQILEKNFGPQNYRLAVPLIRIATAHTAQKSKPDRAEAALQKALKLNYGPSADEALVKAESLASLGDVRVVFGPADESTALYAEAWRTIAGHDQLGASAANTYFGTVRRLYVAKPDVVADDGWIRLSFTIAPNGMLEDVRIADSNLPMSGGGESLESGTTEVKKAIWQATRRSRYRPRVVDGVAIDTPGSTLSFDFCIDGSMSRPTCKNKGDISAVR